MGRILILSEKRDLSEQLERDLTKSGHGAIATGFDDATPAIGARRPDLILVDITLQGGIIEIWRQLRYELEERNIHTIVLIPRDRIGEVEFLEGMTDFISCPYDIRELEMRIKLVLRQTEEADSGDVIKVGNLVIDPARYEVTVDGWPVVLTLKEYELLRYLATRKGRVITRKVLLDQVWGYDYYGGTRTVDVHIGRLRTKIEKGRYSFIKTVRGVGYVFTEDYVE